MIFEGRKYKTSENWFEFIPLKNKPINYLEIGTFYGANLFSVADTYGKNNLSKLSCVDNWLEQDLIYKTFLKNVDNCNHKNKIQIHKGFSYQILPMFSDNYFDIIYVNGNHEPEYVLEDAILSFRKLKKDGYLIFDNYGYNVQKGIDAFISVYLQKIKVLGEKNTQMFIQKL